MSNKLSVWKHTTVYKYKRILDTYMEKFDTDLSNIDPTASVMWRGKKINVNGILNDIRIRNRAFTKSFIIYLINNNMDWKDEEYKWIVSKVIDKQSRHLLAFEKLSPARTYVEDTLHYTIIERTNISILTKVIKREEEEKLLCIEEDDEDCEIEDYINRIEYFVKDCVTKICRVYYDHSVDIDFIINYEYMSWFIIIDGHYLISNSTDYTYSLISPNTVLVKLKNSLSYLSDLLNSKCETIEERIIDIYNKTL